MEQPTTTETPVKRKGISVKARMQKGKDLENWVADQIIQKGLDPKACRSGGSGNGNREKADVRTSLSVFGRNIGFECKNWGNLHIQEWWRQTEKLEKVGREPVLVFKINRDPLEASNVVIRLDTFLELVKRANQVENVEAPVGESQRQRDIKFTLQRLITEAKKLLKLLCSEEY